MIAGLSAFAVALICSNPAAAKARFVLKATVGLSEWTPPQELVLDLDSGLDEITPPSTGWPKVIPKPPRRTGRLPVEELRPLHDKALAIFPRGLMIAACERSKGKGWPLYLGNTIGTAYLSLMLNGRTQSSGLRGCWSDGLVQLFEAMSRSFDDRARPRRSYPE